MKFSTGCLEENNHIATVTLQKMAFFHIKQRAAEKPNKLRYDKISSDRGKLRTACRRQRRRKKRGTRMNQKHIEDILSRIGISCGMNGYRYIVDALLLLDQEGVDDVKYTYLYHLIARKNQSTADRVERDMRYAFSRAREKNTCRDLVEHYIGMVNRSNSASLQLLYIRIKAEENAAARKKREIQKRISDMTSGEAASRTEMRSVPRQLSDEVADRLIRQMLRPETKFTVEEETDLCTEVPGLGTYMFEEQGEFREKLKGLVRELVREIMET